MDTSTNLFIRACKSEHPHKRLQKLFNRFYIPTEDIQRIDIELCHILGNIVDEHYPMGVVKFMSLIEEQERHYKIAQEVPPHRYYTTFLALMYRIRFTEVVKFKGFIKPLKWRLKDERI